MLFFCIFYCVLLFFLFSLGFYFPTLMWFDLVEETFVISEHPFLQQSLNGGCCLHRLGLFTESFCHLPQPCTALEKARLVYNSFKIMNNSITYCLFLFLYCVFRLGFVVRGM
jgi:hypothetical protein